MLKQDKVPLYCCAWSNIKQEENKLKVSIIYPCDFFNKHAVENEYKAEFVEPCKFKFNIIFLTMMSLSVILILNFILMN